jgi:hypothetical protein
VLTENARRRFAPLLLVAAALGAYAMIDRQLPRERDVVLDLGEAAADVGDVEVSWVRPSSSAEQAELTTRWHFAKGTAPSRLKTRARLADGAWEVEVGVQRYGAQAEARWSGHVNLERTPFWKRDNLRSEPVILPVREALR